MGAPSLPVRPQLRHVGIYAVDVERLIAFYEQMLGLTVTDRGIMSSGAQIVFMSASDDQHHQLVMISGREAGVPSTIQQLAFKVDGLGELQAYARFLTEFDDITTRPLSHGNAFSVYFHDPEHNGIEVYCDTPWYVSQPRAIPVDLLGDPDRLWDDAAALAESDPTGMPVEQWRAAFRAR